MPEAGQLGECAGVKFYHHQAHYQMKIPIYIRHKGPIPIFNVVHNNLNLPLVLMNFNTKACSVLGISLLASSNQECNEEDIENKDIQKGTK